MAGAIAQLGERLLCKQEVAGSIPAGSTSFEAFKERTRCDVEMAFVGFEAREMPSFDRTVCMKPCCSLTIRKFFVLTLSFQANVCFDPC